MEAVRTSETSVDNHFTRQYNPEDKSELHTRRRENLKSHIIFFVASQMFFSQFFTFLLGFKSGFLVSFKDAAVPEILHL
jgi:hypothetical protein